MFVAGIEYGDDIPRTAIDFGPGKPLPAAGAAVTLSAGRGWQNSGLQLESGARYRLTATGRYQVAKTTRIWWSEPGGVSIRYYQGRPLGILLAAVRPGEARGEGPLGLPGTDRRRLGHDDCPAADRHVVPEDQPLGRRVGRRRRPVEGRGEKEG